MTDKIIAHGVDVSDCFHRCENMECLVHTNLDGMPTCNCNSNSVRNCYFKQLKRKEQKCEKYEQILNQIEQICKEGVYDEYKMPLDECSVILNIISQAKGGAINI